VWRPARMKWVMLVRNGTLLNSNAITFLFVSLQP
jgi:hypothetical protein